jgi:hypothetical protein
MAEAHVNFKFKIDEKPGGGYIARSDNPALNLEGATKEEVEARVLEKVSELAGPQIAALIKGIKPGDLHLNGTVLADIYLGKKFSVTVNKHVLGGSKTSSSLSPQLLGDSAPPITESRERAVSPAVWYALLIALALLAAWLLTHR